MTRNRPTIHSTRIRPRNPKEVNPDFWQERWRAAQIGFHQSAVHRQLQAFWPTLGVDPGSQVLVPLCGKSLDLIWLRDHRHSVAGVELASVAVESFCLENGVPARRRTADGFDIYEAERLRLFCGDFFSLMPHLLGSVSAVYDRAALIAWPTALRAPYVQRLAALTTSGAKTLLITAEYPQDQMSGPPFSVCADEVDRLYSEHHEIRLLDRQDILANEPRFKSRLTELHEVCYELTRR
jgi:thiopurine S-methyltransferase